MSDIQDFKDFIVGLLADEKFKNSVKGDILGPIDSQADKESVIKAALRCIFGGPQGVGQMPETNKYSHIKNKRNWQPFCMQLLAYLKRQHGNLLEEMESVSTMWGSYKSFWPENEDKLAVDVEKARQAALEQQMKIGK
jgi:hypothetical protein